MRVGHIKRWIKNALSVQKIFSKGQAGFLIIEFALILTLIGLLVGTFSMNFRFQYRFFRERVTRENQQTILAALSQYFARNGHMPHPKTLNLSGEILSPVLGTGTLRGVVPYDDLGLSVRTAKDGYGRWITYVVRSRLANNVGLLKGQICDQLFKRKDSSLILHERNVTFFKNCKRRSPKDGIAVILISHGQGWGAFTGRKDEIAPVPKGKGQHQTHNSLQKSNEFYVSYTPGETGMGDNTVVWLTKNQLADKAGLKCEDLLDKLPVQTIKKSVPEKKE
jgi:hypothetical protein